MSEKVVSVQPVRWLQDPLGRYKKNNDYHKYENTISKHISDLEFINCITAEELFGARFPFDLGIYVCDKNGSYDYDKLSSNSIIEKIIKFIKENKCNFEFNKKDGYRVRVSFIVGGKAIGSGERKTQMTSLGIKDIVFKDGKNNGKWWYEYYMRNQYSKTTEEITSSIKFDTEKEAQNFIDSQKTDFVRYVESKLIVNVQIDNNKILWMGNSVNPRTSLIGYKSNWIDKDFETFFELSEDEIKEYKDFISHFEKIRAEWKNN